MSGKSARAKVVQQPKHWSKLSSSKLAILFANFLLREEIGGVRTGLHGVVDGALMDWLVWVKETANDITGPADSPATKRTKFLSLVRLRRAGADATFDVKLISGLGCQFDVTIHNFLLFLLLLQ